MEQLGLNKFPFFKEGLAILEQHELSIYNIDNETVFDGLITEAVNDIINAFKENKITPINKIQNDHYEVVKFYLTLYILKSMPSGMLYRYWNKAFMFRFEMILNQEIKNIEHVSLLLEQLNMPHKFVRVEGLEMMIIKLNDYLDFVVNIKENEKRFKHLLSVNLPVTKGRVPIPVNEINNFKLIALKLAEVSIYEKFTKLDLTVRSKKIDNLIQQLQGYLEQDSQSKSKMQKQLEYGETTPQMQILNDKTLEMMKSMPKSINVSQFPPCVNTILSKILEKKILRHPENILLACYLAVKGFTKEQMTEVFKLAVNADISTISYNLDYVLERKMKPYNCSKAAIEGCCFKDEICENATFTNPMGYRR